MTEAQATRQMVKVYYYLDRLYHWSHCKLPLRWACDRYDAWLVEAGDVYKPPFEPLTEAEQADALERFIRAGGCPVCGTPPGVPCDAALHS